MESNNNKKPLGLVHPDFLDGGQPPDPFEQEFWTLGQVLIWIYLRDPESLRKYSNELPWREEEWDMWVWKNTDKRDQETQLKADRAVRQAARRELTSGRIPTWGLRSGVGDRLPVPSDVWFDGDFGFNWNRYNPSLCGVCVTPHRELREGRMSPCRPNTASWYAIIARRADALASFPPLKEDHSIENFTGEQQANTKRQVVFGNRSRLDAIDNLIYERLVENGIPQKYDGGQSELEEFFMSEAEARGMKASDSTARRHVKKMIDKRFLELNSL